jgi:flagellar basal body rod protein FlgB
MTVPAPSVVDQVSAALSTASLRHQVIASNVANRDTQGYQRLKLQFDHAMSAAVAVDTAAEPPSLEQDMVDLSANATRYGALTRVLTRYFSIVSAITSYSRG